jgi:hypothetical protein
MRATRSSGAVPSTRRSLDVHIHSRLSSNGRNGRGVDVLEVGACPRERRARDGAGLEVPSDGGKDHREDEQQRAEEDHNPHVQPLLPPPQRLGLGRSDRWGTVGRALGIRRREQGVRP